MPESTQHKLDRIRPPRVQITYDVETRGSFVKMELPFVVGILADLSGNVSDPNRVPLRDRKYIEIDRDNFNEVMKSIGPKLEINTKPLAFEKLDDFSPIQVLEQIDKKTAYDKRTRLSDAVAKLDGNVKLQQKFLEVLTDETKRNELKAKVEEIRKMVAEPAATEQPGNEGGKE
ncbi:MAG TPA: type VI secretion system contractile sheath small subunit [Pyrinomonadaceae bacterium]|nr:type VI secretion system contractile sheath small subunit [Pyrinomonadaceae bacterium]